MELRCWMRMERCQFEKIYSDFLCNQTNIRNGEFRFGCVNFATLKVERRKMRLTTVLLRRWLHPLFFVDKFRLFNAIEQHSLVKYLLYEMRIGVCARDVSQTLPSATCMCTHLVDLVYVLGLEIENLELFVYNRVWRVALLSIALIKAFAKHL